MRARRLLFRVLRVAVPLLVIVGIARLFRAEDLTRARSLVLQVGWPLGFVLLPTLVAMSLDAIGWRSILRTLGQARDVSWLRMVELRVSVESIVLALPGGSVAAEAAKVGLLSRRFQVASMAGAASLALTKLMLVTGDAIYMAVATVLVLTADRGPQVRTAAWLTAGGAVFTTVVAILLSLTLRRASLATRIARWLGKRRSERLRRWVEERQHRFEELDAAARGYFLSPRAARARCFAPFALEWFVEGLETFIILRCLGVPLGLGEALAVDSIGSLLRVIVFFVPAGLGIQDAAQILLLGGLGVPDPLATGAAFVLIKRTKEVFWIVIGMLLLVARRDLWRAKPARHS